jgi:selenocysteine lyase/cysteine desulfurase
VPLDVRERFAPRTTWLNSATYGLPPRAALAAMAVATDEWAGGLCGFDGWDRSVGRARELWAGLVGVPAAWVAIGSQASQLLSCVTAGLAPGTRVLAPAEDFTSLLFPFLEAARTQDVVVELVSLAELAGAIDGATDVVAFSAVQSADGAVADLDAIADAAARCGAMTVVDATQACGWLPLDAARFDVVVSSGYKWLLGPRGTAYMSVRPERWDALRPIAAGWYAGESVMASLYGAPLRLAADARRFDVSPAWHAWVGAVAGLELLTEIGVAAVCAHDLALAARLREGLDLPPCASAIVAVEADADADERLRAAGVLVAGRAGRLRLSTHLYNDIGDVDRALAALTGARVTFAPSAAL